MKTCWQWMILEKIVESLQNYFADPNQREMLQDLQGFGLSFEAATTQQASVSSRKKQSSSRVFLSVYRETN